MEPKAEPETEALDLTSFERNALTHEAATE